MKKLIIKIKKFLSQLFRDKAKDVEIIIPQEFRSHEYEKNLVNTFQATQKLLFNIVPVAADAKGRHFLSIKLSLMV